MVPTYQRKLKTSLNHITGYSLFPTTHQYYNTPT